MSDEALPRIATIDVVKGKPFVLRVTWRRGDVSEIDLAGIIATFRVFAPLRNNPALFAGVHVGEHGTDVVWNDAMDLSADTLWRLAQEQLATPATASAL